MIGLRRFDDTRDALRHEEQMLAEVASGGKTSNWTVWTGSQSLVVPRRIAALPNFAAATAKSGAAGWPVHVRSTGGDVTPQGPGIVNLAICVSLPPGTPLSITEAYDLVCMPIEKALGVVPNLGRGKVDRCFCDGDHNITAGGRKLAGTAQRWRRSVDGSSIILAHALILHNCDVHASVAAVNGLSCGLGQSGDACADAHVNACELVGFAYSDMDDFARAIAGAVGITLGGSHARTGAYSEYIARRRTQLMTTRDMAA